jgi:hypothetical protein
LRPAVALALLGAIGNAFACTRPTSDDYSQIRDCDLRARRYRHRTELAYIRTERCHACLMGSEARKGQSEDEVM